MSNKNYGLNKEREFKKLLAYKDVFFVIKSAGSLGHFDLVAFFDDEVHFYQIKSTKQKMVYYTKEIDELTKIKVPKYARKFLAIYWSPRKDRIKKGWEIMEVQ